MPPSFFATPSDFRAWLEVHHGGSQELWVGFHKKSSHKPSITWPEAVDEALCFGWIDGLRKSIDDLSYAIRFTPRRKRSTWSAVNVERAQRLIRRSVMRPAGLEAFEARSEARSGIYSYEQRAAAQLDEAYERRVRNNETAWSFWQAQPPGYRRTAVWWVVSAQKEETRNRRLATLIEHSERGHTIPALTRPTKR